ncbi:Cysteine-rich secretory protein family protein [Nocardioides alpinus]|uniref:CAP domain-containing protein n=1 Tax=Nocardioides alpinus TaxID=748909 RepID=A0A1I0ZM76_9ACTN|nr:CAP domain-containing protein [Nocardioides alpinus]PKH41936.1 CAP domain-containing protein [Nocardioides alpinus]SFB26745.1 Cysteine-rich secretory protein family protein [Nocardioides alpinus]
MRHPRTLCRLATLGVAAALLCGLPTAAEAKTWSVPTTVAVKDAGTLSSDDLEDALMVEINIARDQQGLRKIWNFDVCTDQMAEQWGSRIARTGVFEHRDQNEVIRRCNNSWAGETLVRGAGLTPQGMVELWLNSPGHREILLSPRARRAGVAVTEDPQGRVIGVVNLVRHN